MRAVLIEPEPRFNSFTPYWRNDLAIKEAFGTPIINNQLSYYEREKIDWIFFSYASFRADFKEIAEFVRFHPESRFGWIANEYNIALNGAIVKAVKALGKELFQITNFEMRTKEKGKDYLMTNLNTLILKDDIPSLKEALSQKKLGLIYYGMYRKGRELYFKRYFDERIIVSTSKKNVLSTLNTIRFSLYLEDVYTHSNYNYPANRFYEALMSRTILLFDENARTTFDKAGYDVSDYLVSDRDSLWKKIAQIKRNYADHVRRQSRWLSKAQNERKRTIDDLRPYFDGRAT